MGAINDKVNRMVKCNAPADITDKDARQAFWLAMAVTQLPNVDAKDIALASRVARWVASQAKEQTDE